MTGSKTRERDIFRIDNCGFDFATGRSAKDEQVLMGVSLAYREECVRTFFFSRHGDFVRLEKRPLNLLETAGLLSMRNPEVRKAIEGILDVWKRELGFSAGPVEVRRFNVDRVGIDDRPTTYEAFLNGEDDTDTNEEQRKELEDAIKKWDEDRMFVFWWGRDYWMNSDGTIHST